MNQPEGRKSIFDYVNAPKAEGARKVVRRVRQLIDLSLSPRFRSYEAMTRTVVDRYQAEEELDYWTSIVSCGFEAFELEVIRSALNEIRVPKPCRVLVVGCGGGREAFAFEELAMQVTATDVSTGLIERANATALGRKSSVAFHVGDLPPGQDVYHLVWTTNVLTSMIPGRANRVRFLKGLRERLHPEGLILYAPAVERFSMKSRFYWYGCVLRARSWFRYGQWEAGDTARAYLGSHTALQAPMYFHYYQSDEEVLGELRESGLDGRKLLDGTWLLRRGDLRL